MPLFEYRCESCGHRFEALVYGAMKPVCPKCDGKDLEKQLSTFATAVGAASGRGDSCSYRTSAGSCSASGGG